jgi:2-hydroxychromene-2-carboxylate isomerase
MGMKHITFHLDFISPYAYLAFAQLPEALKGISYSVDYRPVLFAGMLKHHGQLGPAEIAPKRDWTYRQVMWLADQLGVPMRMPASHPFNPLPLLRLALACGARAGDTNRFVCEQIFKHVWTSGADMNDAAPFEALLAQLKPVHDVQSSAVKSSLTANTEVAIRHGVFGVPAFEVDDKIFWGLDALPMLRDYLLNAPWFDAGGWERASQVAAGTVRN